MMVRSNRPSSLSPEEFARLQQLVETQLGVLVPTDKRAMLQSRLARRCRELGFAKVHEYCEYLFGPGQAAGESVHFFDAVTTNYTYFYREPEQLEYLAEHLLPEFVHAAVSERRPLYIWCAACSTGEEPWTLAMMSDDAGRRLSASFDVRLAASDVSTRVLDIAARGVYRQQDLARLPPEWRERYFMKSKEAADDRVRVIPQLRGWTHYQKLNLMDRTYPVPGQQDIIFLRNILIYFDASTRQEVIGRIGKHLRPGGLLVLGTSESMLGLDVSFKHVKRSIFRKEGK
jgi:chemotaxis protein methyltransferase CheR